MFLFDFLASSSPAQLGDICKFDKNPFRVFNSWVKRLDSMDKDPMACHHLPFFTLKHLLMSICGEDWIPGSCRPGLSRHMLGITLGLLKLQFSFLRTAAWCHVFVCRSKHEEIDLVSLEEFYKEAPPDISKAEVTMGDPHQQTLARLDWELEQRKR